MQWPAIVEWWRIAPEPELASRTLWGKRQNLETCAGKRHVGVFSMQAFTVWMLQLPKSQFPIAYLTLVPARYHGRSPSKACCQFRKVCSKVSVLANPKELISNWYTTIKLSYEAMYLEHGSGMKELLCSHAVESCRESAHLFQLLELYFHLSFSNISWSSRDQQPKLKQSQQGNQRPRQFDSLWDPLRPAWIEIMSGFIQGSTLVNRPSCSVPSGFLGTSFCAPSVLSLVNLRFHLQWEWNQSSSGWQSWKRYDK